MGGALRDAHQVELSLLVAGVGQARAMSVKKKGRTIKEVFGRSVAVH